MKRIGIGIVIWIIFSVLSLASFESHFDIEATYDSENVLKVGERNIKYVTDIYDRSEGLAMLYMIRGRNTADNKFLFEELKRTAIEESFFEDYQNWSNNGENVYFRAKNQEKGNTVNVFYIDNTIMVFTFDSKADSVDFDQLITYIKLNKLIDPGIQNYINIYLMGQRFELYINAEDKKFQNSLDSMDFSF